MESTGSDNVRATGAGFPPLVVTGR
jgi:hypothetical protein